MIHISRKKEGHRSVLTIPLVGGKSDDLIAVVEEAVKENIVVVTTAGKQQIAT